VSGIPHVLAAQPSPQRYALQHWTILSLLQGTKWSPLVLHDGAHPDQPQSGQRVASKEGQVFMERLYLPHRTRMRASASPATTMREPETVAVPDSSGPLDPDSACPFHTVTNQLAHTAVMQQVLYLEGEVLPRDNLLDAMDGWGQLYRLVRTHVCPATRQTPLTQENLAALVDIAVPQLLSQVPVEVLAALRQQLVACATCLSAQQCPLGNVGSVGEA
jgi:hypothetical protein